MPRLALGFIQLSNQWEPDFSPGVKQVRMWSWPHLNLIQILRMCEATPPLSTYLHDVVFTKQSNNFTFEESSHLGYDTLKDRGRCIISLLGLFNPEYDDDPSHYSLNDTLSYLRKLQSPATPLGEPQISHLYLLFQESNLHSSSSSGITPFLWWVT